MLWAATHSTLPSEATHLVRVRSGSGLGLGLGMQRLATLPSEATHFSRPHCMSLGSLHCSSTCARESA